MMETAAGAAVAVVLLAAVAAKTRLGRELPELLSVYGIPRRLRAPAAAALVVAELVVALLLLARVEGGAVGAVALGVVFVGAALVARARGARRLRCGCFGAAERPWAWILARAVAFLALAGLAAWGDELGWAPAGSSLVPIALVLLTLAVVVLAVLVLALYRQVGVLSLRIAPHGALELEGEGPPLATPAPALSGLARRGGEVVAFFSEDCRLCRDLAPGVRALAREGLAVHVVYEARDTPAFTRWNVPGTPFVVHVIDGVVAAKGLVNTLEQLDGLVATGRARREHAAA
jgi:hypothetical protein